MSLTPIPPERCGHVAPMVIERAADGYSARCLRCGTTGPARETSGEARRALLGLGGETGDGSAPPFSSSRERSGLQGPKLLRSGIP
jgi:hypothetical protein